MADEEFRATALLRLASSRRRVGAFLHEIETLEGSEFPHPDAEHALREIKVFFQNLLRETLGINNAPMETLQEACFNINLSIQKYTPILGFIIRSTNVRNAFELHFPLKRLIEDIIGDKAKLIISSEWDFVPFTYPMNLDLLPDFVLVGDPAPESGNALITPLAAHEIGHSAWRQHRIDPRIRSELVSVICRDLAASNLDNTSLVSHLGPEPINLMRDVSLRQLEEIFCDAIGIFIFGGAYAFAYEHLMYPAGLERMVDYPSNEARIRYIVRAAAWHGYPLDDGVFRGWKPSKALSGIEAKVAQVVDGAVEAMVQRVFEEAKRILIDAEVGPPDPDRILEIERSFGRRIPDQSGGSLAEIVNAGWLNLRKNRGLASSNQAKKQLSILNEIMLKSVEVSEYLYRVG